MFLSPGSCAGKAVPWREPVSRVTPKLYGDEPFPKQPALILTLEPVPVQDLLWVG